MKLSSTSLSRQTVAAVVYAGVVAVLAAFVVGTAADLSARFADLQGARDRLAQFEAHAKPGLAATADEAPASPFIEGSSITVAGAKLQQRVGDAVLKAGGAMASSQIVVDGPRAKDGFISLTASVTLPQPAAQTLLYDLEAGSPYLFVDSLTIQSPRIFGEAEGAPLRLSIGVSGQWRAEK